jgi:hypothetical protein
MLIKVIFKKYHIITGDVGKRQSAAAQGTFLRKRLSPETRKIYLRKSTPVM